VRPHVSLTRLGEAQENVSLHVRDVLSIDGDGLGGDPHDQAPPARRPPTHAPAAAAQAQRLHASARLGRVPGVDEHPVRQQQHGAPAPLVEDRPLEQERCPGAERAHGGGPRPRRRRAHRHAHQVPQPRVDADARAPGRVRVAEPREERVLKLEGPFRRAEAPGLPAAVLQPQREVRREQKVTRHVPDGGVRREVDQGAPGGVLGGRAGPHAHPAGVRAQPDARRHGVAGI